MSFRTKLDGNRVLRAIPDDELAIMAADLTAESFELNETVYEQDAPIDCVYFPIEASFSVIKLLQDGTAIEVATVGKEGIGGIVALLNAETHMARTIIQIPGVAYRMPVERFREHRKNLPGFHEISTRYAQVMYYSLSQAIACNRFHQLAERGAKWLLMTYDRAGTRFPMTHEFLALMLGVNRPTVTLSASTLQDAGLISYSRGEMTILDLPGLEKVACECYGATRAELYRLLPEPAERRLTGV
jgi:CRP-like cAMP-binding protein